MSEANETIVALATPSGSGALAVVKISGNRALNIAYSLTSRTFFTPRHATLSILKDREGEMIDEAIIIYFQAPHSYTAEDVVEIQCHGGVLTARKIIEEVLSLGARVARAGEFTYRAFLNGRIDLSQAEAVAQLINAKSEGARKILARQLKGALLEYLTSIRESLLQALAFAEVSIDYAEEDLPPDLLKQLDERLSSLAQKLQSTIQASSRRTLEGVRLSLIGRPNVGKSSLLNAILMWERSIVSAIPGTTRDTIEESFHLGDHLIKIIDTAGIRESRDEIELLGISRTLKAVRDSDVVLALFDVSEPLQDEDRRIKELLKELGESCFVLVLFNKSDLPKVAHDEELLAYPHRYISAQKGETEGLLEEIKKWLDTRNHSEEFLLTSTRQSEALSGAAGALCEARERLESGELELFAYHIHEALAKIASITRPYEDGELLDAMFSEFCLGK